MNSVIVNMGCTVVLLAGTLFFVNKCERRSPEPLAQSLESVTASNEGWTVEGSQLLDDRTLSVLHPTAYLSRSYRKKDQLLALFVAYYAQQRSGETMHSPKNCLPGSGWEIWKSEEATLPMEGGKVKINKYFIQNAGRRLVVFYWYQSRDRIIANEYLGKILLIRDAIVDASTAGALVRVMVADDPEISDDALKFSAGLIPQIKSCFRQ